MVQYSIIDISCVEGGIPVNCSGENGHRKHVERGTRGVEAEMNRTLSMMHNQISRRDRGHAVLIYRASANLSDVNLLGALFTFRNPFFRNHTAYRQSAFHHHHLKIENSLISSAGVTSKLGL
jgi:hypothetical protein